MTKMTNVKADRVENILKIEFDMMQNTQNIGGRASCQDDWETYARGEDVRI